LEREDIDEKPNLCQSRHCLWLESLKVKLHPIMFTLDGVQDVSRGFDS